MLSVHGYGKIIRIFKSLKPKKSMCAGCDSDFYNTERNGCWSFSKAKVVKSKFYRSLNSVDYDVTAKTLSCFCGSNK